jgi:hypothetical protein
VQHVDVLPQPTGGAVVDHLASPQQVGRRGDLEGGGGRLLHQEARCSQLPVESHDGVEQGLHHERGEAERQLVDHHHLRLGQQRPADDQHLLLAAGQAPGDLRPALGQPGEYGEDRLRPSLEVPPGATLRVGPHEEVLLDRHPGEDLAALRHEGDAPPNHLLGGRGERFAVEEDLTSPRQHAGNGVERGRLPRSVGSDHGHDLAGAHGDVDAAEDSDGAVAGGEAAHLKHGRRSFPDRHG